MKKYEQRGRDTEMEKFVKIIQDSIKKAEKRGLTDLEFVDQIPDNEIQDEPIPFPYGGRASSFDKIIL